MVASALMLALFTFLLPVFAAAKANIRIVNAHPSAEVEVNAYDANDWLAGVSCQRLYYSGDRERIIPPRTAEGVDRLFRDHCGNYAELKLYFNVRFEGYTMDRGYKHFEGVIVPWGATVTFHANETISCNGCAWQSRSR